MKIFKFGGASVKDAASVKNVTQILLRISAALIKVSSVLAKQKRRTLSSLLSLLKTDKGIEAIL